MIKYSEVLSSNPLTFHSCVLSRSFMQFRRMTALKIVVAIQAAAG